VKSWSVTIPQGVREVVGRRLNHLSKECNGVLTVASVIGREFGLDALDLVSDVSGDRLLEALEEAMAARVISEVPRSAGRYSFSHALIRETLYEELTTTRRVRLHRQIGEVLEGLYGANPEPHLAELAHHFCEAAPGGDVDKAIDYARRAGDRAAALLAYEEAAGHYETALQALEVKDQPDEAQRCELLLARGESLNSAGRRDQAREISQEAADVGRRLGDPERLARAALAVAGPWGEYGTADTVAITLLEEALAGLGSEDSTLRVRVLGRLALALAWALERERTEEYSRQALEMAQRLGDARALADALWFRQGAYHRPSEVQKRLEMGDDLLQVARDSGDGFNVVGGHWVRLRVLLELGDIEAVDVEIERYGQVAQELRLPSLIGFSVLIRAMRALLEGRFEEAERLGREAFALGQRAQDPLLVQNCLFQLMALRWAQGRLDELEALVRAGAQQSPNIPGIRAGLAMTYAELGREEQAKVEFEGLAVNDFSNLPLDSSLPLIVAYLSVACGFLDDARRAAVLYDLLLPYAGHTIILGVAVACLGSASHSLGVLAATMERWEDAERHFEDALEMNARMGARPWVAHTQHGYADMLLRRGKQGDREKALELVTQALDTAQELGMKALVDKALALKLQAQGIDTSAPQTSIDAVAASVYVDKPDLRSHAAPDGTVTIMFSDIEGSTAMTERLGDQRWLELLREHNALVRRQVKSHGGFEVKSEGDGFMLAFQSARRALECAIDIQRGFAASNEKAKEPVKVRIGLHTGEAIKEGDDFFGKHVNLAARVAGQAQGGEILVSSLLKELTESAGEFTFGEGRKVELKGLAGPHRVFEVRWREEG
ncbi:MAG TPA: adenylate/guanylate cyclase domain-containing protein, partial [Dehalococcoidia bacterium]|nr:adenylate/guanylate cyclase domain-containing protein [Dehalococcoidia bacterium]